MTETVTGFPEVVGLTLNYRDAARTLRCISSLLGDGVAHVLIWDNSNDGGQSANELRTMLEDETRASVEVGSCNLGFAAGVNRGLAWIRTHFPSAWVLLINNDAVLLSGATSALASALSRMPKAVIAYPSIEHGGYSIGTAFYQRHFGLITVRRLPGSIPHASGCCQLMDPERLSDPWFDEEFFMYGEDVEFGHRLGVHRMLHVPEILVLHEGSASSGLGSLFYETRLVAAHWLLARKLARNRFEFGLFYCGRVFALTLRAALRAWRYRSWIPFRSLYAGWGVAHRR